MAECPVCGFVANTPDEEIAHMNAEHPEVIEKRMIDAGFQKGPDGEWVDALATDS